MASRFGWSRVFRLGSARALVLAAGLAVAAMPISQAFAQGGGRGGGGGMMGDMMSAPVSSSELDTFATILNLTREQKDAVRALYDGQRDEFRTRSEAMREKMRVMREDGGGWEGMQTTFREFRAENEKMEAAFFEDVKALITPAQAEQWPRVERAHRRERTVGRGLMSGERVDLVRIVDGLKPDAAVAGSVAPVLAEYEEALDRALVDRNKAYEEGMQNFRGFQDGDMEAMQKSLERSREASKRVREVNSRYARQLREVLPEDSREKFDAEVQRASFPQIYRATRSTRDIDAALKFTDLSEDQRSQLTAIRDSHASAVGAINQKWSVEQREFEENLKIEDMMNRRGGMQVGDELRSEKRDLDRAAQEQIRKVLTPDQVQKLPRDDENEDEGFGQRGQQRQRDGGDQEAPAAPRRARPGI